MQLGIDLKAAGTRYCLSSALLGAGPGSWGLHNHRMWEEPSWIGLELGPGGLTTREPTRILTGTEAVSWSATDAFERAEAEGQSVVWPRFPRKVEWHPDNFGEGFLLFWQSAIPSIQVEHPRCRRIVVTSSLARERRLAAHLSRSGVARAPTTIPDFFAAYVAAGESAESQERVVYLDLGAEALRLTQFRTWADGGERWVVVEQTSESPELGLESVLGAALPEGDSGPGGVPSAHEIWRELERIPVDPEQLPARFREAASQASQRNAGRVMKFVADGAREFGEIDRVLAGMSEWWIGNACEAWEGKSLAGVGRLGPARGASLFSQRWTYPVHFLFPGTLYLSLGGKPPVKLLSHDQLLSLNHKGRRFAVEAAGDMGEWADLLLLWGPDRGDGPFVVVNRSSLQVSPSSRIIAGATIHRSEAEIYGSTWAADSEVDVFPEACWSLDLREWSFWSAR